jgi:hypothetical protein
LPRRSLGKKRRSHPLRGGKKQKKDFQRSAGYKESAYCDLLTAFYFATPGVGALAKRGKKSATEQPFLFCHRVAPPGQSPGGWLRLFLPEAKPPARTLSRRRQNAEQPFLPRRSRLLRRSRCGLLRRSLRGGKMRRKVKVLLNHCMICCNCRWRCTI